MGVPQAHVTLHGDELGVYNALCASYDASQGLGAQIFITPYTTKLIMHEPRNVLSSLFFV